MWMEHSFAILLFETYIPKPRYTQKYLLSNFFQLKFHQFFCLAIAGWLDAMQSSLLIFLIFVTADQYISPWLPCQARNIFKHFLRGEEAFKTLKLLSCNIHPIFPVTTHAYSHKNLITSAKCRNSAQIWIFIDGFLTHYISWQVGPIKNI